MNVTTLALITIDTESSINAYEVKFYLLESEKRTTPTPK